MRALFIQYYLFWKNTIEKIGKTDRSVLVKYRNSVFMIAFISTGLLMFACSLESDNSENRTDRLIPAVEAVQARYGTLPLTQRLSGVVKAKNQVAIYPEISAIITDVLVTNGEAVKKGQVLIRLRDKEFRERLKQAKANYQITMAQLSQAEAELKENQAELKRYQALAEKELASPAELETIQTRAISAAAGVELAHARVEQAQEIEIREDVADHVFQVAAATAANRSSMGQDVDHRRPTEIKAINGFVVREAERLDISVPVNRTLTALVQTLESHYL